MNDQELLDSLEKQGVSRRYAKWVLSYCKAGQIDPQTIDIKANFDPTLTYHENKDIFKQQHPLSNIERLAKDNYNKAVIEHTELEAMKDYLAGVEQLEAQHLESIRSAPESPEMPYTSQHNETLKVLIENVANGFNHALFLVSNEAGIGKSTLVLSTINNLGNKSGVDYEYISGYATPLDFYNMLYMHKDKKVIILDDMDLAFQNRTVQTILKSATWSVGGLRKLSYHTTSKLRTAPAEFILKANIIVIANSFPETIMFKALISRGLFYEIKLSQHDKLKLLAEFVNIPYKNLENQKRHEVIDFVIQEAQKTYSLLELNYRTVVKFYELCLERPADWQKYAINLMVKDDIMELVEKLLGECGTVADASTRFTMETGFSRRSFFRIKKKLETLKLGVPSAN